jgi:hypothetical protein
MVACVMLINLNLGWVQVVASEIGKNEIVRAARIDAQGKPVKPAVRPGLNEKVTARPSANCSSSDSSDSDSDCSSSSSSSCSSCPSSSDCECKTEINNAVQKINLKINDSTKTLCNKIGDPSTFPSECDTQDLQNHNVIEFLKEILRKVCTLDVDCATENEVRAIVCSKFDAFIGQKESFPCSSSSSSSDSDSDSDCSSSSSCSSSDEVKTVFEFLREILEKLCFMDCADEEQVRQIINSKIDSVIGVKSTFPAECAGETDIIKLKTLFEFAKETLKRLCALNCATEEEVNKLVCQKFDCFLGKKRPFPSDCSSCSSSSSDCGSCSSDSDSDCSSSSSSRSVKLPTELLDCDACGGDHNDKKGCSSSDSSDSSDCGCSSSSSSSDCGCSSSSSSCSSSSNCGNDKNVFDFLHEILKRVCNIDVTVDCATEKEVKSIVCSKFDSIIGSKTTFPEDCIGADLQTSKTLFQFLKEILRRICEFDCASPELVKQIVCSKVDRAVTILTSKIAELDVDCATSEELEGAVKTIVSKINASQATLCSKIAAISVDCATSEDVEHIVGSKVSDLQSVLLSKIDQIDCDVDLGEILSKLCDLHRCIIDEDDCCDDEGVCLKDRVKSIQKKVCTILSKINIVQSKTCDIDANVKADLAIDKSILSKVCALDNSDIVECCASVQSKLDELTETVDLVDENLNSCCFTIISKLENLDQDITIDESILSKVCDLHRCLIEDGGCCEVPVCLTDRVRFIQSKTCTILSKVNGLESAVSEIQEEIAECCEESASNLDSCCFTLNSKVDVIDGTLDAIEDAIVLCCEESASNLDSCCFTLESQMEVIEGTLGALGEAVSVVNDNLIDCCSTLNSKIDLLFDSSVVDFADCCFTLDSKLDQVTVDVNECCFTVVSQIDQVDENLLECCFTLESKIDGINISTDFGPCCFTINSRIDVVDENLLECCFTVNSKIDDLSTDFDACCFTLESKVDDCCNILVSDFNQTWTLIGDTCAVVPNLVDDVIDVNTTCTFSVMQWLKLIYAKIQ